MNNSIIFEPTETASSMTWLIVSLVIAVLVLAFSMLKKHKILTLVTGLITFILAGTTVFSWIGLQRTSEVIIADDYVETMYGTISFDNIKNVYIKEMVGNEFSGNVQQESDRILIIEARNEKAIALPEGVFPIDSIKRNIDLRYRDWKMKQ